MIKDDSVEKRLEHLFGYSHAVLFGRARSGLTMLLETVGAHGRFPVLLPSNICPAVLAAICGAGASPRLVPVSALNGIPSDEAYAREIEASAQPGVTMITHLYGFWQTYPKTRAVAAARGWLLLENDSLAVTARLTPSAARSAVGDALLVSFGYAKTLEIGVGGAILTDDASLARTLAERAASYPVLDEAAVAAEAKFNALRRSYRQPPHAMPGLAEALLPAELGELRYAFPPAYREPLKNSLDHLSDVVRRRRDGAERWQRELQRLEGWLVEPDIAPLIPWRVIRRAPRHRDRLVQALRANGFDAGTNFPPLTDAFPNLLAGQRHADAQQWADEVINLWVGDDYDDARIRQAVSVMEQCHD